PTAASRACARQKSTLPARSGRNRGRVKRSVFTSTRMDVTDGAQIDRIRSALDESARVKEAMKEQAPQIQRIAARLAATFREGGRLYACGNGGSACDAMHFVEELVARYKRDRPGIPAHHLLDAPTLTCWSNDFDYSTAFRRQVETLVTPRDVLVAISTSGDSKN